jgi:hypothetical protein
MDLSGAARVAAHDRRNRDEHFADILGALNDLPIAAPAMRRKPHDARRPAPAGAFGAIALGLTVAAISYALGVQAAIPEFARTVGLAAGALLLTSGAVMIVRRRAPTRIRQEARHG